MALILLDFCKMFCKIEAWEGQRGTWDCKIRAAYFVHGFLVIPIDGGCHSVHDFFWVQWWGIPFSTNFSFCLWWWFSFCTRFCAHWLPPISNANFKRILFDKSNILQNASKTAKRLYIVLPCSSWCSPWPWDSKKLHFLASCSRLSFLSQEATSRSLFFWLPATFFSFLANFWCSRSLIFRLLGPRSSFLAQEAASWKLASWKPKKPILEAKKTSFLNSPRSYFLKSKKVVFLASRKHVKLKLFWFKVVKQCHVSCVCP